MSFFLNSIEFVGGREEGKGGLNKLFVMAITCLFNVMILSNDRKYEEKAIKLERDDSMPTLPP